MRCTIENYDPNKVAKSSTPEKINQLQLRKSFTKTDAFSPPLKSLVHFKTPFRLSSPIKSSRFNDSSAFYTPQRWNYSPNNRFQPSPDTMAVASAQLVLESPKIEPLSLLGFQMSNIGSIYNNADMASSCISIFREYMNSLIPVVSSAASYSVETCEMKVYSTNALSEFLNSHTVLFENYPPWSHWKIAFDIGNYCKQFQNDSSLYWFQLAVQLQPYSQNLWLEYAKYADESNNSQLSVSLLGLGWLFTKKEIFLTKSLRILDRLGCYKQARNVLSILSTWPIQNSWKLIMEGIKMEVKLGNLDVARSLYNYVLHYAPKMAPVYIEACSFEESCGNIENALNIVKLGLENCPRFSPLWFLSARLSEILWREEHPDDTVFLQKVRSSFQMAVEFVAKELLWKVYFEAGSFEARTLNFDKARDFYVLGVSLCPSYAVWKFWLAGARLECLAGNSKYANMLLEQAESSVSIKNKVSVMYEWPRFFSWFGKNSNLVKITSASSDWRLRLEYIIHDIRNLNFKSAINSAEIAVKDFPSVGRLWALLMQLKSLESDDAQISVFQSAIIEVPKSGEVWCEGARTLLNPTSKYFNVQAASNFLNHAVKFTPQYGDTFIEVLRVKMLTKGLDKNNLTSICLNFEPSYGALWFKCKDFLYETTGKTLLTAYTMLKEELFSFRSLYQQAMLGYSEVRKKASTYDLENWKKVSLYSICNLYPSFDLLTNEAKWKALFGSDPIVS